jgi:hypothetical protein
MCPQCPFARTTPKEYLDTMGDNAERFAGQALGPFALPCHMHAKFSKCMTGISAPSPCAGAAIYRSNCGYDHLRGSLPMLPADTENVFASPAELIAHHRAISAEAAEELIEEKPIPAMLAEELSRAQVKVFPNPFK